MTQPCADTSANRATGLESRTRSYDSEAGVGGGKTKGCVMLACDQDGRKIIVVFKVVIQSQRRNCGFANQVSPVPDLLTASHGQGLLQRLDYESFHIRMFHANTPERAMFGRAVTP